MKNQVVYILKVSNQNEDGSYDYVKMAGVFAKKEDAIAKAEEKIERMMLEWWGAKVTRMKNTANYQAVVISETGIRKWYEVIETEVK